MNFKKLLSLVLIVVIAFAFVACGDNTSSGGEADSTSKGSEGNGDVVTLTFMGWEASPLETEAVRDGIAEFESQNQNVKVDYTPSLSGGEYTAKLLSSHAGGSMPDVMFMQSADYRTFASKGVIHEITDRFGGDYLLEDFIPAVQELMLIDDKVYGIQSCIVAPVLYYNKSIFDEADVEYPSTDGMQWEEFRQKAIELTSDDVFGVYGTETTNEILYALLASNGTYLYADDYETVTIDTPEAREVFNAIRDLRYVDKAAVDATTLENIGMSAAQMLETGKVAMVLDGSWALQELATLNFDVGVAPIPYFKELKNSSQAHLHCIAEISEHKDEAWEFLKFLSGMDYQGELVAQGLWMPNRLSMYEEDVVEEWYDEEIHGEYIDFLDYFINGDVSPTAMQKTTKANDIVVEETDKFYKDGGDIDDMISNLEIRITEAIEEEVDGN